MPVRKHRSHITLVQRKLAADTKAIIHQTLQMEDEFGGMYDQSKSNAAIQPPFNPLVLKRLCTKNNTLMQCIHAMESNIDGTGYELADDTEKTQTKKPPMLPGQQPPQQPPGMPGAVPPQLTVVKEVGPVVTAAAAAAAEIQSVKRTNPNGMGFPIKPGDPMASVDANGNPLPVPLMEEPEDPEKKMLDAFFKEPFPNESFVAMRRKLRIDIESTGNGYMEVIRNLAGEVAFLRHLDASTMRLVKLDNPVMVTKIIERDGNTIQADMWVRERRYVQRVGNQYIYYKEFGATRKLSRDDGGWINDTANQTGIPPSGAASPGNPQANLSTPVLSLKSAPEVVNAAAAAAEVMATQRAMDGAPGQGKYDSYNGMGKPPTLASEVLHFICDKDALTPYGVPRWINNLPAILGSRKAEEFNLDFFDSGGLPPAIIFIQGGALAASVREQLEAFLGGSIADRTRAAIVEAQSSSGSLDAAGQVKVTVERFGDNKANNTDSMFQAYDEKSENHVRGAFRLPSIFLGKANDYNFATALTAVMVTEAQVFSPERKEFDEQINHTIVRALGAKRFKFKSLPITLKNVDVQLKALELAAGKVDGQELITTINQITGLNLEYSQQAEQQVQQADMAKAQAAGANMKGGDPFGGGGGDKPNPFAPGLGAPSGGGFGGGMASMKAELSSNDIVLLAGEWANAIGLTEGPRLDKEMRRAIVQKVESLSSDQRKLFNSVLANSTFARSSFDQEGLAELAGCCVGLIDHQ